MSSQPIKILLIEDEPDHRELFRNFLLLTGKDCSLDEAGTEKEALKSLAQKNYDIVFLDYRLPGTTGGEILVKIKARSDVPVVMLTGMDDVRLSVEMMKRGAYNYIVKSQMTEIILSRVIENTLEKYRLIKEYKNVEETLRASENKYRTLLENLPQKIFFKDRNSAYISCNENLARDFKIKPDEIPGKTDCDFFPAELAEKYRKDDKRIMDAGEIEDIEEKYLQDGQEVWVHTVKIPVRDDKGDVVGILGIFWDITEHKQAEEKIRAGEKKWLSMTMNTDDTIVIADKNNIIRYVNKTIPPQTPDEVVGRSVYEYVDKSSHGAMNKSLKRVYETGVPDSYEVSLDMSVINPEMDVLWFRTKVIPMKSVEEITGVIMVATDITESKRAEEELRKQSLATRERVKELRCLYAVSNLGKRNISLEEIFWKTVDIMSFAWQYPEITCVRITFKNKEFRTKNFKDSPWKQTCEIIASGRPVGSIKVCYLEEKPEIDEGPFLKEEKELIASICKQLGGFVERRQAEEEKGILQNQLIQTEKMATIGQMASGVAHELKNPLAIILQNADLLDSFLLEGNGKIKKSIEILKKSVNRANSIITDLLGFSRTSDLELMPIELHKLLDDSISLIKTQSKLENIKINRSYPKEVIRTNADSIMLQQVFFNLFVNAIDVMPDGGELNIKLYSNENSGKEVEDKVTVEIEDTGEGISKNILPRIFDPFFTTKKAGEGTGMGLNIAHMIIMRHKGTIDVESKVDKGTKFTIKLPRV
jgi:PAS domain S-box-containing protein